MQNRYLLSIIIPCYNEEETLVSCVDRVLAIKSEELDLEIIIVDDSSRDRSLAIAKELEQSHFEIRVYCHTVNQGKGAALRTGFQHATGDFVAVQDADLEYDPEDLLELLEPLKAGKADVVLGSRFLSAGVHRVFYFWHYMGNRFLTFLSNMFTDLNLTDMETCYKVFRREVIQSITIEENRFGFEPEIVAKIAQQRLRIYEAGISYDGRTYSEGKKIGVRDGFRALYCIFKYNAHRAPLPIQMLIYFFIGGTAALVNLGVFLLLYGQGYSVMIAAPVAFVIAALVNYFLCVLILFKHNARWSTPVELLVFGLVVAAVGGMDLFITSSLIRYDLLSAPWAKSLAALAVFVFNFFGRKYFVFPENPVGEWRSR